MIIVLKLILIIFGILSDFVGYYFYKDYKITKNSENFKDSSLFEKLVVNVVFITLTSMVLVINVFVIYLLFSNIYLN